MTMGANIQWGYAGLINFGIMGYVALGGLAAVLVSVPPVREADNTSDLSVLSEMINKLNMGYDLVLASCYLEGGGVEGTAVHRKLLSFCANLLLRITTPLKDIHTFSSFYRVYRASLIKKACEIYGDTLIQEKGFSCMVELLLKLAKLRIKIAEVPMILKGNLRVGKRKR